jgi:hypothetical protein
VCLEVVCVKGWCVSKLSVSKLCAKGLFVCMNKWKEEGWTGAVGR